MKLAEITFGSLYTLNLKGLASRFAIISDDKVAAFYGESLLSHLRSAGLNAELFSFPGGEENKSRGTKEELENQLFEKGFGRDSCIIALGGGVVTDLAGFIAATYCRGLPLVMIPTSLLAMVDASLGGKTGVNVPYGKNLLGAVYQPKMILVDPDTLKTLPQKELSNGVVEMIKHALIADEAYFNDLEAHAKELLAFDLEVLKKAIFESMRIKREIVEEDEMETGKRRLLNFGHTVGHALETLSDYTLSHGEAVAIGLLVENYLSVQLGHLPKAALDRIKNVLLQYQLPLRLPFRLSEEALLKAMTMDKKSLKGRPRFVMIDQIGSPLAFDLSYCGFVEESLIKEALHWMTHDLCCY